MLVERTQLSRSSEQRVGGSLEAQPPGGRGWRYPWGWGLGRPALVLGKAGLGPLLLRRGSWGAAGPGLARCGQGSWA